jgi:hypothetical protein
VNLVNNRKYVENPVFRDDQIIFPVKSDKMYIYQHRLHTFNSRKAYMIIRKALLQEMKKIFTFGPPTPFMAHPRYGRVGPKKLFFNFVI